MTFEIVVIDARPHKADTGKLGAVVRQAVYATQSTHIHKRVTKNNAIAITQPLT